MELKLKQHPPGQYLRGFTDASLGGRKFSAHAWVLGGRMRNSNQIKTASARTVPQRIYGRISWRPEILCPCLGTGRADAELE